MLNRVKISQSLFKEGDFCIMQDCNLKTNYICIYSYCRSKKQQKIQNIKNYQKAQSIMKRIKVNGCAICGYDKCDAALSFHHVNYEDREFNIEVSSLNRTNNKISEELNKCILLCCRCHRELHAKERLVYDGNEV